MCEIMEEAFKKIAIESEAIGIIKIGRIKNQTDEQIINNLITILGYTKEEAQEDIKQYDLMFA